MEMTQQSVSQQNQMSFCVCAWRRIFSAKRTIASLITLKLFISMEKIHSIRWMPFWFSSFSLSCRRKVSWVYFFSPSFFCKMCANCTHTHRTLSIEKNDTIISIIASLLAFAITVRCEERRLRLFRWSLSSILLILWSATFYRFSSIYRSHFFLLLTDVFIHALHLFIALCREQSDKNKKNARRWNAYLRCHFYIPWICSPPPVRLFQVISCCNSRTIKCRAWLFPFAVFFSLVFISFHSYSALMTCQPLCARRGERKIWNSKFVLEQWRENDEEVAEKIARKVLKQAITYGRARAQSLHFLPLFFHFFRFAFFLFTFWHSYRLTLNFSLQQNERKRKTRNGSWLFLASNVAIRNASNREWKRTIACERVSADVHQVKQCYHCHSTICTTYF